MLLFIAFSVSHNVHARTISLHNISILHTGENRLISNIIKKLQLERLEKQHFRGNSIHFETPAIYGGQLLAQVLYAGSQTLETLRPAHSLQANFVSFGDRDKPLEFSVQNIRDGKSTSVRQINVSQDNNIIMVAIISFQDEIDSYDHQCSMPETSKPKELLLDDSNKHALFPKQSSFPFKLLKCKDDQDSKAAISSVWIKPDSRIAENVIHHQMLFAFVSDATILQPAFKPHGLIYGKDKLTVATMNHTIWFHRELDSNDWVLIHSESPNTFAGRALAFASVYNTDGDLLASLAQEGIFR